MIKIENPSINFLVEGERKYKVLKMTARTTLSVLMPTSKKESTKKNSVRDRANKKLFFEYIEEFIAGIGAVMVLLLFQFDEYLIEGINKSDSLFAIFKPENQVLPVYVQKISSSSDNFPSDVFMQKQKTFLKRESKSRHQ
jgi:hypothetical protein